MAEKQASEKGGEKKAFVLRLNASVLKEIEAWASDEFRSVNGQIEYLLNKALDENRRKKKPSK
ncbi:MAG: DNA-binding protein [Chloroherpetonaceae bacterium]|nr:DNA-binding protein [Chloroherpetonaceae bacterium]